jgi:hypothetical protein
VIIFWSKQPGNRARFFIQLFHDIAGPFSRQLQALPRQFARETNVATEVFFFDVAALCTDEPSLFVNPWELNDDRLA